MTLKCSPLAPLSVLQSIPLCQNDLITENNGEPIDDSFLESFNAAWSQLLKERGCLKGLHQEKISALQKEALRLKVASDNLKVELSRQSTFVRTKRDEMEAFYQQQFEDIEAKIQKTDEKSKEKRDMIETAIQSAALTLPWLHFMRELDRLGTMSNSSDHENVQETQGLSIYRSRAIVLAKCYAKVADSDNTSLMEQRVDYVENALLKSHIQMLTLERERLKIVEWLQREFSEELQNLHQ